MPTVIGDARFCDHLLLSTFATIQRMKTGKYHTYTERPKWWLAVMVCKRIRNTKSREVGRCKKEGASGDGGKRQVLESAKVRSKAIPLESSFLTSRE